MSLPLPQKGYKVWEVVLKMIQACICGTVSGSYVATSLSNLLGVVLLKLVLIADSLICLKGSAT